MATRSVADVTAALVSFINSDLMAPGHRLAPTDRFEAAGIDSMALLKVLLFIEREFGFWVPDEDLVEPHIESALALATYVCQRAA
jgi:acyl carrier protein